MTTTFADGLDDLAGDDIRRWRGDRPAVGAARPGAEPWAARMRDWIGTLMAGEVCRRPLDPTELFQPVPISDPGSTHVPTRPRSPT